MNRYWDRIYAWWSYGSCKLKRFFLSKACTLDNNWQILIWWRRGLLNTSSPVICYIRESIEFNCTCPTVSMTVFFHLKQRSFHIEQFFGTILYKRNGNHTRTSKYMLKRYISLHIFKTSRYPKLQKSWIIWTYNAYY